MGIKMPERRTFLLNTLKSIGIAVAGGALWGGFVKETKSAPLILRPPGALPENDFLARCTKCGLCVGACPFHALMLAKPGDGKPVGTPHFVPRENPCAMCRDIPCVAVCPTAALDRTLVSEQGEGVETRLNINLARMGLAVIDRETCIAYAGIQCDACYRACPLIDRAIVVEYSRNARTGKHAILAPVVRSAHCTGCGLCERACITKKASVFVLPREIAMGESTTRYIKGWDPEDEKRAEEAPEDIPVPTPRSEKDPLDYLNKGEL